MSNADRPPIPSNPIESTITEENRDMQVPDASGKDKTYQVPMVSTGSSSNVVNDHDSHQDNANNSFDITRTLPAQQDKTHASLSIQPVEDYTTWPARDEQLLHAVIQHIPFASTVAAGDSEQWDLVADTCNKGLEQLVNRIPPFVNGSKAKERFKILMAAHAALVHSDTQRVEFLPIYEQYERIRSLMEYCYSLVSSITCSLFTPCTHQCLYSMSNLETSLMNCFESVNGIKTRMMSWKMNMMMSEKDIVSA